MALLFSKIFRCVLIIFALLLLTHCGDSNDDLKKYVEKVNARPGPKIEPLPEAKPMVIYHYSSSTAPNPFALPVKKMKNATTPPNQERPREELEAFSLDALKMVGTLGQGKSAWVLILAPNGGVYRVKQGNHLGQNYGEIVKISPKSIDIDELINDPDAGWQPHHVEMKLAEKEQQASKKK